MVLTELVKQLDVELSQLQNQQFELYADLLIEWNQKINLTAITDRQDIYIKHFYDSLLLEKLFKPQGNICDVGSGAGFPGIPLAISNPQLNVCLIEPIEKRCNFLRHVCQQLNLNNVEVINSRAEDFKEKKFEFVTSRAVAPLNILSELCIPLVQLNGHFIAMKGPRAFEEVEEAKKGIDLLGGKIIKITESKLPNEQTRICIDILKTKETPIKYPRHYSKIKKNPL